MKILRVKQQDGSLVDIPIGKGSDGKSAYNYAKHGGYTGTEAEFTELLGGIDVLFADVDQLSSELIDIKTGAIQLVPEFANSIEECTDTTKLYVLPDGYIYAYMAHKVPEVTTANFTNQLDEVGYTPNTTIVSGGSINTLNGCGLSGYIQIPTVTGHDAGQVVFQFDNIEVLPEDADMVVILFDSTKTFLKRARTKDGTNGYTKYELNYELDANGYIKSIDVSSFITTQCSTAAFARISVPGLDDNSVIALNEEISYTTTGGEVLTEWANTGHMFVPSDYADYEDRIVSLENDVASVADVISSTKKYGVRWSVSNPDDLGARCFSAEGLRASIGTGSVKGSSDFDNIYPWSEMKRCNIKTNVNGASIVTYEGDSGFALDGSNGDVFVRIPKFTVERYIKDGYEYRVIGDANAPIHEVFIENGVILDEIFISAFEGYIGADNKLRSIANVLPTSNETPSTYLTSAKAKGENYSLYDMRCVDAIWTLMAVEFGCRNTNQIIGYGIADFMQPVSNSILLIKEEATNTNSVKVSKFYNYQKSWMPVGSNITICDTDQKNIVAQRKITKVEDTSDGLYTIFTFDGSAIDVNTNCFIGSAALNTNFCELCSAPLTWHTGRAEFISGSTTKNPIRYRWIENVVGNLWHFLPDITFNDRQMYVCKDMQKYQFHKYTDEYKPVGDVLVENSSNGSKNDEVNVNYWIDSLLNDTFAKSVLFAKSYNKALTSTQSFGGYYYLHNGVRCIANGGGFDHLYRCNMLTQRAWIDDAYKWYLCGARLMFKKIN